MYFLPRNSKFYAAVVCTRALYRYCGTLFVLSAVLYGWHLFFYAPLKASCVMYERDIMQAREQFMRGSQARVAQEKMAHSVQELKTKIRSYTKGLSPSETMQHAMTTLMQQAHTHRCEVSQCRMEQERDKQWYTKQALALELHGDLSSLNSFLAKKDSALLARCSKLALAHEKQNGYQMSCVFNCLALH
jgi:hypothetical protein